MARAVVSLIVFTAALLAVAQAKFRLGPLEIVAPSGYAVLGTAKRDRMSFSSSSPKLDVLVVYGQVRANGDAWGTLNRMAQTRRGQQVAKTDVPEPRQTRWNNVPALLYRLDEGSSKYRFVLSAVDVQRDTYFQLEIAFLGSESQHVQRALEAWTRSVKYIP